MMGAFLYGTALQWRLDIRSRTLLITCYVVPLLFFAMMGGIFTSVNPSARETLVPSMTVMGVSMGALIGLPPSLVEIYGSDIKKMYKANGVPLYFGLIPALLSTFLHLMLMSAVIYLAAPPAFGSCRPGSVFRCPGGFYCRVAERGRRAWGGSKGSGEADHVFPARFSSLHSSVGYYVPVGAAARRSWCGGTDISCVMGLLPDEGRRIFRWEPVAAGSGDGNVVRSLHAAAQALGERVRRNRTDKMFWDKAVLFIEAPTAWPTA